MPVIETFFYWILFVGTILALVGQHKKLPTIIMLGAIFFVSAGVLVQSNGIDLPTGYEWTETADGNYSSNVTYTTYQEADFPELFMVDMVLIFGGAILLLYGLWATVYFYEESKREREKKAAW